MLVAIQAARIFPEDSKTFVDLSLLVPPDECWRRWEALPQPPSDEDLRRFVLCTFAARPGEGQLEPWQPPDYQSAPPLLARLPAGPVREWASALNQLWPRLGRRLSAAAAAAPERHTMLPVPHGVIIPGGRFREAYYWDSYWVVLGLLSVGMFETARGLAEVQSPAISRPTTSPTTSAPLPPRCHSPLARRHVCCAHAHIAGRALAEPDAVRGSPRLCAQRPPPLLPQPQPAAAAAADSGGVAGAPGCTVRWHKRGSCGGRSGNGGEGEDGGGGGSLELELDTAETRWKLVGTWRD